jgi:cyclopropane-fatty-acyl-phospholipid synthase
MREINQTATFPDGVKRRILNLIMAAGRQGHLTGPSLPIEVNRYRMFWRTLVRGDLGFAETFIDGDWSSADLAGLLELCARAKTRIEGPFQVLAPVARALRRRHRPLATTRPEAAANVAFHYDLGNAFYAAWLDPTMTYSSALFTTPGLTLAEAQEAKYRRIAQLLRIGPEDRVLEIGCGWGGFAEYAAREIGCHVTGITLSREQAVYARERLRRQGLGERTEIRLEDYRDVQGSYKKIVSIEMFEAVGEAHWPLFFEVLRDRLSPGGIAGLQVIIIGEDRFEGYRRRRDFIQRYIFPGGMLPSLTALSAAMASVGLRLSDRHFFGASYAATLAIWNARFQAAWNDISRQGFDERFRRMWSYYLAYCEVGFQIGRIDVGQFAISRN